MPTIVPDHAFDLFYKALYLPMIVIILERDRKVIEQAPFKLNQPYLALVEDAIKTVRRDLSDVKRKMRRENMKIVQHENDGSFTRYTFYYKGHESLHNFFNYQMKNKVDDLLKYYLNKRFIS